jgi:hypothetical protein
MGSNKLEDFWCYTGTKVSHSVKKYVKKCFLGLQLTALLLTEGKKKQNRSPYAFLSVRSQTTIIWSTFWHEMRRKESPTFIIAGNGVNKLQYYLEKFLL